MVDKSQYHPRKRVVESEIWEPFISCPAPCRPLTQVVLTCFHRTRRLNLKIYRDYFVRDLFSECGYLLMLQVIVIELQRRTIGIFRNEPGIE